MHDRLEELKKLNAHQDDKKQEITTAEQNGIQKQQLPIVTQKKKKKKSSFFKRKKKKRQQQTQEDNEEVNQEIRTEQEIELEEFLRTVQEIKDSLGILSKMTKKYTDDSRLLHDAHNKPGRDDDVKLLTERLSGIMEKHREEASKVRLSLKSLNREIELEQRKTPFSANVRMKKNQVSVLSKKFLKSLSAYEKAQEEYKSKSRDDIIRQCRIVNANASKDEIEKFLNSADYQLSVFAQMTTAKDTLAAVKERHVGILKVESSINELHEMFVDLSLLIEGQGGLINEIDNHVSTAKAYMQEAVVELAEARRIQKHSRCLIL